MMPAVLADTTELRINAMNRINAVLDGLLADDRISVMSAVIRIHRMTQTLGAACAIHEEDET